jgi:hypothetical protein
MSDVKMSELKNLIKAEDYRIQQDHIFTECLIQKYFPYNQYVLN